MKKIKAIATLVAVTIYVTSAQAQTVQIGALASYLAGSGQATDAHLFGGGIHGKFYLKDNIAIGGVFKIYPKRKMDSFGSTSGPWGERIPVYEYSTEDQVGNLMGSFDYLFCKSDKHIRPFVGIDAGISFSSKNIFVKSGFPGPFPVIPSEQKNTVFIAAPKAGVNFKMRKNFGLFAQAQYNFAIHEKPQPDANNKTPVYEFVSFDTGIFFQFTGLKKGK